MELPSYLMHRIIKFFEMEYVGCILVSIYLLVHLWGPNKNQSGLCIYGKQGDTAFTGTDDGCNSSAGDNGFVFGELRLPQAESVHCRQEWVPLISPSRDVEK